jgi:hypothetical protein
MRPSARRKAGQQSRTAAGAAALLVSTLLVAAGPRRAAAADADAWRGRVIYQFLVDRRGEAAAAAGRASCVPASCGPATAARAGRAHAWRAPSSTGACGQGSRRTRPSAALQAVRLRSSLHPDLTPSTPTLPLRRARTCGSGVEVSDGRGRFFFRRPQAGPRPRARRAGRGSAQAGSAAGSLRPGPRASKPRAGARARRGANGPRAGPARKRRHLGGRRGAARLRV